MLTAFFLENSDFMLKFAAYNKCNKHETESNIFN